MNLSSASPVARARLATISAVLLFGLTGLIFIEFAPFRGATVGAVDITTRQTSPFTEDLETEERSRNTLQSDQVDSIAMAATFWRAVQDGDLRMWEPNVGTGVPLGGVVYTRVWSPLFWAGLVVEPSLLSSYSAWAALWIAQLGAWALARRMGIGRTGALLTGVAYGYSGPVTALLLRIHETAFAPWVFLAVHYLVSCRSPRLARGVAGLSLVVAATWLGGFPAGGLFVLYGAGAIAVGSALLEVGWDIPAVARRLVAPLAGVVGGTLLASPLLLPSFEFLAASESLDRAFGSDHAAGLALFGTAVSGRILGTYPEGTWWWPDPGYSNPVEISMTVGMVALALLLIAAVYSRCQPSPKPTRLIGRVYMPLGLVVFVGTFLGGPVLAALQLLPFVGSNSFGRSRFLLSLVIALAAGNALDGLGRPRLSLVRLDPWFRAQSLALGVMGGVCAGLVFVRAAEEGMVDRALYGLIVPLACLFVACFLGITIRIVGTARRTVSGVIGLGVVLLLAIELQWGSWGFTPVVDNEEGFYPYHTSFEAMEPYISDGSWRFAGTDLNVIRPDSAAWLQFADLRTSSPSYRGYRELMRAIDPHVFDRARLRTWFTGDLDPSSTGLDRSAVRYLVAPGVDGVLEAMRAEHLPVVDGTIRLPRGAAAVRGLLIDFGNQRCAQGFVLAARDGEVVGRQPLWQVGDVPFALPLPDISDVTSLELSIGGCDIDLPEDVRLLRAAEGTRLHSIWAVGAVIYQRLDPRPRIELVTAVEGVADPEARLKRVVSQVDNETLILDDDRPHTDLAGGTARLTRDTGDELDVDVQSVGPGYLVIRDADAPGWEAYIDGQPVEILAADHAFRAVQVPDGRSTVEMRYAPDSRTAGIWIALGTVLALGGGASLGRFGRNKTPLTDHDRT